MHCSFLDRVRVFGICPGGERAPRPTLRWCCFRVNIEASGLRRTDKVFGDVCCLLLFEIRGWSRMTVFKNHSLEIFIFFIEKDTLLRF